MTPTPVPSSNSTSNSASGSGASTAGSSTSKTPASHGGSSGASPQGAGDLVKDSLLYREFVAERDEILRHKWLESEKAGHDIGFEKALLDWVLRYRAAWRLQRAGGSGMAGAR
jgi:hypothetical protein